MVQEQPLAYSLGSSPDARLAGRRAPTRWPALPCPGRSLPGCARVALRACIPQRRVEDERLHAPAAGGQRRRLRLEEALQRGLVHAKILRSAATGVIPMPVFA